MLQTLHDTALQWRNAGHRLALLTLSHIQGTSPRPLGAQMLVRDDGVHFGQISSGCVEGTLMTHAQDMLQKHNNTSPETIVLGQGGQYFDLSLPCGSTISVDCRCDPPTVLLQRACAYQQQRQRFYWYTTPEGMDCSVASYPEQLASHYFPSLRVLLFGAKDDALVAQLGAHLRLVGAEVEQSERLNPSAIYDSYSAVITLWHDHDRELPILAWALSSDVFYIGCLGSYRSHQQRLERLQRQGHSIDILSRITAPAGSALMSKQPGHVALAIAMEVVAGYDAVTCVRGL